MNYVIRKFLAAVIFISAASAAQAASYNFGYTFMVGSSADDLAELMQAA
jgi:hypothetical protein